MAHLLVQNTGSSQYSTKVAFQSLMLIYLNINSMTQEQFLNGETFHITALLKDMVTCCAVSISVILKEAVTVIKKSLICNLQCKKHTLVVFCLVFLFIFCLVFPFIMTLVVRRMPVWRRLRAALVTHWMSCIGPYLRVLECYISVIRKACAVIMQQLRNTPRDTVGCG